MSVTNGGWFIAKMPSALKKNLNCSRYLILFSIRVGVKCKTLITKRIVYLKKYLREQIYLAVQILRFLTMVPVMKLCVFTVDLRMI